MAPDEASLPGARALAERRFGMPAFGLREGGLIGTPPAIAVRLDELREMGFSQTALFTPDRASAETLELFAAEVVPTLRSS